MIIKNWMNKNPVTIGSNQTASEAMQRFDEHGLPFLPVVDKKKLRGILARRDLRQAASYVTATQSVHEMNYFNERLKVKDLMVRKPITLSANDTIDTALEKGQEFGRSFFPIMEDDELVGTISDIDISNSLYQILGIGEELSGITLEDGQLEGSILRDIVVDVDSAGGSIHSIFTLKEPGTDKKRLVIRFKAENPQEAISILKVKNYAIVEKIHN